MTRWRNICCAVDFGEPSRRAMEHAAALAGRFGAELTLVHAVRPEPQGESDVLVSSRGHWTIDAEERERLLRRWADRAASRAGRPVRTRLVAGDPAAAILRHVREQPCDLLVVGTRGARGMLGIVRSMAGRLSRRSPCPVMVVHDHELREKEGEAEEAALYQ